MALALAMATAPIAWNIIIPGKRICWNVYGATAVSICAMVIDKTAASQVKDENSSGSRKKIYML